ncbi:MAG: FAD-dependent oxidoreductase [Thermoleophilia bacterium]|nr:FAD-dependent oxidoreductase [Thermoleophilia bacterium]
MKHIAEPARSIPVLAETEVLVVGSGPGGLAAAIAAAREGARTILLDRYGCFGGLITQAGVETIAWYRHDHTVDTEGIGIEFERRAAAMGATQPESQSCSEALDTELFKHVADELVREAGVEPLLHCLAVAPLVDDGLVTGVVTESKSGRQAILACRVIDATGDADLAARAGAPCRATPAAERMGVSIVFSCVGVDRQRFLEYITEQAPTYGDWRRRWKVETTGKEDALFSPYLQEPFDRARESGLIPADVRGLGGTWGRLTAAGEATCLNMVYIADCDCTDVRDLTRAEMEGRRRALMALEALRRFAPGFEAARLRDFGMAVGGRDSRKIAGRHELTAAEVTGEARFADSIGIFPEFIDGYGLLVLPTTGRYFQVPYGILVPRDVDNLLVAGRCVAGDKVAHAATRSQVCCAVTGQAAGVAAAVSLRDGVTTGGVDVARVQTALRRQGVRLF